MPELMPIIINKF